MSISFSVHYVTHSAKHSVAEWTKLPLQVNALTSLFIARYIRHADQSKKVNSLKAAFIHDFWCFFGAALAAVVAR